MKPVHYAAVLLTGSLLMGGCTQRMVLRSDLVAPQTCEIHTPEQATAFRQALETFKKSDFAEARDAFAKYIESNPRNRLVFNAYFWQGSASYAMHDYPAALISLSKVADAQQQRYAPEALLLIGIILETVNPAGGQKAYWTVVSRYPYSDAAVLARGRLGLPAAPFSAVPGTDYGARVAAAIRRHVIYDGTDDPSVEVKVLAACNGRIIEHRITRSSGVQAWDAAVLKGLDKTQYLPLDADGAVPPEMIISYRARPAAQK